MPLLGVFVDCLRAAPKAGWSKALRYDCSPFVSTTKVPGSIPVSWVLCECYTDLGFVSGCLGTSVSFDIENSVFSI